MATIDFTIKQGKTFSKVFRWGASPLIFKPITAITQTAPVKITAVAHGLPEGWPVAIVSVKDMLEINSPHNPPWAGDYQKSSVVDVDNITLPNVDASEFTPYSSGGGYVRTYTPVDLTNYVARMSIKDRVGGTVLASFTSTAGDFVLDNVAKTITLTITAVATAAYTWTRGVYDIELANSITGYVKELAAGNVVVIREVTT